jgi:ribonucleoside-diphosphate reductase alpha chain
MICFFDRDDDEMLAAKEGEWWRENAQRARSNNSAVLPRQEVTEDEFVSLMRRIQSNNTGEPGIFWTTDAEARSNPCVEASLDPFTFCNLTTINVSDIKDEQDFLWRVRCAAIIGTLQASYTNFAYLSPRWSQATRRSSLLGVSLTGLASNRLDALRLDLSVAAEVVKAANEETAMRIGMPIAHRTTLIKPEGTTSLVLGTSSGLHAYHSPFYLRGITVGKDEPIYPALQEIMPENLADLAEDPDNKAFAYFPMRAPDDAITRHEEAALELLERAKHYTQQWIEKGHRFGEWNNARSRVCNRSGGRWRVCRTDAEGPNARWSGP